MDYSNIEEDIPSKDKVIENYRKTHLISSIYIFIVMFVNVITIWTTFIKTIDFSNKDNLYILFLTILFLIVSVMHWGQNWNMRLNSYNFCCCNHNEYIILSGWILFIIYDVVKISIVLVLSFVYNLNYLITLIGCFPVVVIMTAEILYHKGKKLYIEK